MYVCVYVCMYLCTYVCMYVRMYVLCIYVCMYVCMREEREAYRVLVGKPEGKRPLWRPRCRWVDNIIIDLQEVRYGSVDCIGLPRIGTVDGRL